MKEKWEAASCMSLERNAKQIGEVKGLGNSKWEESEGRSGKKEETKESKKIKQTEEKNKEER